MKYKPDPLCPNSRLQAMKLILHPPRKRRKRNAWLKQLTKLFRPAEAAQEERA